MLRTMGFGRWYIFVLAVSILPVRSAVAAVAAPAQPLPGYSNTVSGGISAGTISGRDATFRGWSLEYARQFRAPWSFGLGLAWDRETERFEEKPDKDIRTYTFSGTISYALSDWFVLTTGLGTGIADDDNSSQSMEFSKGDVSTALIATFGTKGLPFFVQDSINFSIAAEYNLSQNEPSYSLDLFFGWSY